MSEGSKSSTTTRSVRMSRPKAEPDAAAAIGTWLGVVIVAAAVYAVLKFAGAPSWAALGFALIVYMLPRSR